MPIITIVDESPTPDEAEVTREDGIRKIGDEVVAEQPSEVEAS